MVKQWIQGKQWISGGVKGKVSVGACGKQWICGGKLGCYGGAADKLRVSGRRRVNLEVDEARMCI